MSSSSSFASEFGGTHGGGGSSGSFANLFGNHPSGSSPARISSTAKPQGSSGWGPFNDIINTAEHVGGDIKSVAGNVLNPGDVWGNLLHGGRSGGIEGALTGLPATAHLFLQAADPFGGHATARANAQLTSGIEGAVRSAAGQVGAVDKYFYKAPIDAIRQIASGHASRVGHVSGGDLLQSAHQVNKDPFQYATTLAAAGAAPAAGEGLAIRGASLGERANLAERGGLLGSAGRALKTGGERAIAARKPVEAKYVDETGKAHSFTAPRARTVQGRAIYNPIRERVGRINEGGGLPGLRGTGNAARFARSKLVDWGAQEIMNRSAVEANRLASASSKLSSAETFAARHAVEFGRNAAQEAPLGEPRLRVVEFNNTQIRQLKADAARIEGTPPRKVEMLQAIRRLQNENKIFTHPRVSKAIDQAIKNPSPEMTKALDTGEALHQANQERLAGMGAIHPDEPSLVTPGITQGQERILRPQAMYQGMRYDEGAANPATKAFIEKGVMDRALAGEPGAVTDVLAAHQAAHQLAQGAWVGGPDLGKLALEHPDAQRVPEYARGAGRAPAGALPAQVTQKLTSPLRKINAMKQGKGVLRAMGRLTTAPDAWNRENLDVARLEIVSKVHQGLKDEGIAIKWDGSAGDLRPGYSPVNLDGRTIMRSTHGDLAHLGIDEAINRHLGLIRGTDEKPIPEGAHWQMPTKILDDLTREIRTSKGVIARLAQHPLNYWRAAVLKYRPAWLVNNIVGQHLLYLIAHPAGVGDYVRALNPDNRKMIGEELHGVFQHGSTSIAGGARVGAPTFKEFSGLGKVRQGISPLGRVGGFALKATESPIRIWKGFGNLMLEGNRTLADNIPRTAIAIRGLREYRTQMRILEGVNQDLMKKWGDHTLQEIAQQMSPQEKAAVLGQVNRALGNFNLFRGRAGQNLRLVVPFASWFAVIARITADLALEYPEKVAFISHMNRIAQQSGYGTSFPVPSYEAGSVQVGARRNGYQPLLTMQGLNPFSTIVGLAQSADAAVHGKVSSATGSAGPISLLGPVGQAASVGLLGVDPFTGRAYSGPGQNQGALPRIAADIGLNLPQIRLLQQIGVAPGYVPPKSYRDRTTRLGGKNVNLDAIYRYLGVPVRNVNIAKSREYKRLGY